MSHYEDTARKIWLPWYQQDYRELIDSVKESIKVHIETFKRNHPEKVVYGYSIYTCNGFPHFGPVLNTVVELETKESQPYYQYCPDEWSDWDDYSCFEKPKQIVASLHREFDQCEARFEDMYEENDAPINAESEDYWQMNIERIHGAILSALSDLKSAGVFDWLADPALIMIWYSDPSDWELLMAKKSIESLVGVEQADEFSLSLQ
ncbi:DUF4303 domain-containing protein [Motilimonas sp. 1_MG-2023]|uniref:DUF4303 domain-containing protein n=1 Tax=Motilimonas sp. 1_MG-2023 TaxID=3062672 RepID=UPI0026E2EA06|nr:DUF4303 domain-containing protein [Motilimonas sp. 1_MG-2023]MDO6525955.1 DUF4303 domain-containing protein [Motilimonas sp. 1_MG-2023]